MGTWLLAVSAYNTTGALVEETNTMIELEATAPSPETARATVVAVAAPASTKALAEAPGFGVVLMHAVVAVRRW